MLPDLVEMLNAFLSLALGFAQLGNLSARRLHKSINTLAGNGTGEEHLGVQRAFGELVAAGALDGIAAHLFFQALRRVFHAGSVDFVAHHDTRALGQFGQVHLQLVVDDAVILYRIAAFVAAGKVDDVKDNRAALHMA